MILCYDEAHHLSMFCADVVRDENLIFVAIIHKKFDHCNPLSITRYINPKKLVRMVQKSSQLELV